MYLLYYHFWCGDNDIGYVRKGYRLVTNVASLGDAIDRLNIELGENLPLCYEQDFNSDGEHRGIINCTI